MNRMNPIRLKTSSIVGVPLNTYDDFTFIVNGEKFRTSRICADLLSRKISSLHRTDPTINEYSITTSETGHFSYFLRLVNFQQNQIPQIELPFISEIIEKLETESVDIQEQERIIITDENVFELLRFHLKSPNFYSRNLQSEIDHISSHFYELCYKKSDELMSLQKDTLELILSNSSKLQIDSEDQLVTFLNSLASQDSIYSQLFEYVNFSNVSTNTMKEFLCVFNQNNITREMWNRIASRLELEVIQPKIVKKKKKFLFKTTIENVEFKYDDKKQFCGILNHLRSVFKDENVFNEIDITSSSTYLNDDEYSARNVIQYEDRNKEFCSKDVKNSWLCVDFKNHRIVLSDYSIRSFFGEKNEEHPKSWVVEGSNDKNDWEIIDEHNNNASLNGENLVQTFSINESKRKQFRFIRMRLTGENWSSTNCLDINAIEFYGRYI